MNANELAEDLEGAKLVILRLNKMLRQQQAEILAGKIMIKGYSKTIDEQQAEIEALKEQPTNLQELTLTNDDIKEVIKSLEDSIYFDEKLGFFELKEFAEAILRKAQKVNPT